MRGTHSGGTVKLFLVTLAAATLLVSGCSKKEGSSETAAGDEVAAKMMPPKEVTSTPGTEAVPGTDVPEAPLPGLFLDPFFDEAGTKSEIAVAPGERFELYIMAQTDSFHTQTTQLRLQLPPGLSVKYTVETDQKMSSMGKHDYNYLVVYTCRPGARYVIVSYVLEVAEDFQGGAIQVLPGFNSDSSSFLGFGTCEYTEVRAAGGTATVKLKA